LFTYFGIILGLSHYERIYDTVPLPSLLKQSSLLLRAIEKKELKSINVEFGQEQTYRQTSD
jgi:hypothetical protein